MAQQSTFIRTETANDLPGNTVVNERKVVNSTLDDTDGVITAANVVYSGI